MGQPSVVRFGHHLGAQFDDAAPFFDILYTIIQQVLKSTDDETLRIVSVRMAAHDGRQAYSNELLQIDEAMQCMDLHDHKVINDEKKAVVAARQFRDTFSADYRRRATQVREAAAASSSSARGKNNNARGGGGSAPAGPRPKLPPDIPQSEAKLWIPPMSSIWKDNTMGAGVARSSHLKE